MFATEKSQAMVRLAERSPPPVIGEVVEIVREAETLLLKVVQSVEDK